MWQVHSDIALVLAAWLVLSAVFPEMNFGLLGDSAWRNAVSAIWTIGLGIVSGAGAVVIGLVSGFAGVGGGTLSGRRSRTTIRVALALGAVLSVPSAGLAETIDEPAQFAVLGLGSAPCANLIRAAVKTAASTEADRQAMLSWAQGYLSFYNSVTEGTYDVTRGAGADALENWLLEFCRKNPRASLMNAVDELLLGGTELSLLPKPTTH
jgi:hypothetical protein